MTETAQRPGEAGHLNATLGLGGVTLFGLAYMAPIIVLGIFGVIAEASAGASAGSYLLATVAMLFTAASYAKMSVHYPVAGSSYTYVRKALDSRLGFLVGWTILLDYLFLPLVIWLIGAAYLTGEFPAVPAWVWIVAFIVVTTALNILGLKVADKANLVLMALQFLVIALFIGFAVAHMVSRHGGGSLLSVTPFSGTGGFPAIAAGAAIAAYSFLGFDAVSTLTEDTKNPQRNIPRAIMLVALIGGVVFVTVAYILTLVQPGGSFPNADSLAADTARTIGGALFAAFFVTGLIIGQFTSGLAAQASVSRLLYAMGRDSVLPKKFFGTLSPRFFTPVFNIVLCGLIGLGAVFLSVATSTSFINFGAFTAFTLVNLSVIGYFVRHRHEQRLNPLTYVAIPLIGAVVDVYLLTQLGSAALTLGVIWMSIGVVYLLVLTRGLRVPPPELSLAE
ncbi:APC family permease [Mycolicibacterium sp. NCC-Tsukiji]|uniref:APC family permease n=1 Tax=Mycolicibacterium sp. NCC-Tsukiji TaxID=2185272 RepID=UPI000ECEEBC5|nr:APC family permease [Mycolicibacterium sp. NCC-Tsukiji]GCB01064.1 amino acid permease [Mycolicibacterium sp. NCC-Tsukiji]